MSSYEFIFSPQFRSLGYPTVVHEIKKGNILLSIYKSRVGVLTNPGVLVRVTSDS